MKTPLRSLLAVLLTISLVACSTANVTPAPSTPVVAPSTAPATPVSTLALPPSVTELPAVVKLFRCGAGTDGTRLNR